MFKVVKSRKANKIAYLLVLVTMLTSLAATPMKAYAVEVGDVLYEETNDNYVQEDITEKDEEYYYPEDTEKTEDKKEETKQEETKQEETKTEDKKEESSKDANKTTGLGIPPTNIYCLNKSIALLCILSSNGSFFSKHFLMYSIIKFSPSAQANSSKSNGYIHILRSSEGITISLIFSLTDINEPVSI